MTPFTEEEHALAADLQNNAIRLSRMALSDNIIGLMNDLETMVTNAISSRTRKRPEVPRRRALRGYEKSSMYNPPGVRHRKFEAFEFEDDVLLEHVDPRTLDAVSNVISHPGERASKSRLQIAHRMIKAYPDSNAYIQTFMDAIDMIKRKLGLQESKGLDDVLAGFRLINEQDDDNDNNDKEGTSAPSKDRETGEILYHLDMSTRHLDVLVDYTLIAGHETHIVSISSAIQKLAQQLRSELETQRTPLDKR